MTRKRIPLLAALLVVFTLVLVSAGCGGDDEGSSEGTGTVSVFSLWGGSERDAFQKVLDGFTEETGITAKYEQGRDFLPILRPRIAAGNPPDVAIIPRPGVVADFARDGSLKTVEEIGLDTDALTENLSQSYLDLGTVDGDLYGIVVKANSKNTIWYKPDSFRQLGVEPPTDWQGLLQVADAIKAKGKKPFAVGAQGSTNSWTLTDWFENIYLHQAGPEKYQQLFTGDLPFTDPSVKTALGEMTKVISDENVPGGIQGVLGTDFVTSIGQVFGTNSKAEMHGQGGFVGGIAIGQVNTKLKPITDIDFFDFPTLDPAYKGALMGAGDQAVAFTANDDVKALMEYLASPEAGEIWAKTGAIISPNKAVPDTAYPNELAVKEAKQLKEAETFRFDGSDLLPGTLGQSWATTLQAIIQDPGKMDQELGDFQSSAEGEFEA